MKRNKQTNIRRNQEERKTKNLVTVKWILTKKTRAGKVDSIFYFSLSTKAK